MKKKSLVLLCTLLLASAPGAYANDAPAPGLLDALLDQLVAMLSSANETEPEMGWQIPPGG